jgi:hypothetical protein
MNSYRSLSLSLTLELTRFCASFFFTNHNLSLLQMNLYVNFGMFIQFYQKKKAFLRHEKPYITLHYPKTISLVLSSNFERERDKETNT